MKGYDSIKVTPFDGPSRQLPVETDQQTIDAMLQHGEALSVDMVGSNGGRSQYLPTYCQGSWPHCLSCSCQNGE
jgi:hypothetical protein